MFQFYAWEKGMCQMSSAMSKKSTITIKNGNTYVSCQLITVSLPFYGNMAIIRTKKNYRPGLQRCAAIWFFSSLGPSIKYFDTFFQYFGNPSPILSVFQFFGAFHRRRWQFGMGGVKFHWKLLTDRSKKNCLKGRNG